MNNKSSRPTSESTRSPGKRAKRRFGNDKAALDAIAGPKAGAVCRARLRQKKVQVGKKAEEFFANVKDFIAAKHEIDATAERVLPRSYMDSYKSFKPAVLRHAEGMSIDDVYQSAELTRSAFSEMASCSQCRRSGGPRSRSSCST